MKDTSYNEFVQRSDSGRPTSLILLLICLILLYQSMKQRQSQARSNILNGNAMTTDIVTNLSLSDEQKRQLILSSMTVYEVDGEYFIRSGTNSANIYIKLDGDKYKIHDSKRLLGLSKDGTIIVYYDSTHIKFEMEFDVDDLINYYLRSGALNSILVEAPIIRRVS